MTGMPAQRFGLERRGLVRKGYYADLVIFDADAITDTATFSDPVQPAQGIKGVWVNGVLSYTEQGAMKKRSGRFLPRGKTVWVQ